MKVKIIKASSSTYWYKSQIGTEYEVVPCGTERYTVVGSYGKLLMKEDVEVVKETPRLYNHEGVNYVLPEWATYVTCDGGGDKKLFAWEFQPQQNYYVGENAGFGQAKGKREIMEKYVKPLPEGAFIAKVI